MPDVIRLRIITDDPESALAHTLACAVSNAPSWVQVISDPDEIMKIPNGVKCIAVWFSGRKHLCEAEKAWRERRLTDGIVGLDDRDWVKLEDWISRHKAKQAGADIPAKSEDIPAPVTPPSEIRHLVQTQRWT